MAIGLEVVVAGCQWREEDFANPSVFEAVNDPRNVDVWQIPFVVDSAVMPLLHAAE